MKYFFAIDSKGTRHVIVAQDLASANEFAENDEDFQACYELTAETFTIPGYLISSK